MKEARTYQEIVDRIRRVAHPLRVVLFGSRARGTAGPESDIDLMVVVSNGTSRHETAGDIYQSLIGVGAPVDVVVVTEDDVARYRDQPALVVAAALQEGTTLYAA